MKNLKLPIIAAAAALGLSGVANAATVQVTGVLTDYRQMGVSGSLAGVTTDISTWTLYDSNRDPAFPGVQVFSANVAGFLEIEGGVVTGGTISLVGDFQNDFAGSGGGSRGLFQGIVWEYDAVAKALVLQPGIGEDITGTCTIQSGTGGTGCSGALAALQNEDPGSIWGFWDGVPADFTVSNLFGAPGSPPVTVAGPEGKLGAAWTVAGTDPGASILAQLTKGVPAFVEGEPAPNFNAVYAAKLELQVVPLPATAWMLITGLGLIGAARGRKLLAR